MGDWVWWLRTPVDGNVIKRNMIHLGVGKLTTSGIQNFGKFTFEIFQEIFNQRTVVFFEDRMENPDFMAFVSLYKC